MFVDKYSEKLMEHFLHPHNMGRILKKDIKKGEELAIGKVGNPVCGDLMEMFLKIERGKILDAKILTFGCASAIACASVTTDLVIGRTIAQAKKITKTRAAKALKGLPQIKLHCSNLASEALQDAIRNYEQKRKGSYFMK